MGRIAVAVTLLFLFIPRASAQTCQAWRQRATTGPSPRGEFGMTYDARRGVTVLVGGANNLNFNNVFRETWEWGGNGWTLVSTGGPTQRCDNAVNYDSVRQELVSFGGYDGAFLRDTWTWNGAQWQQKSSTGPVARADASMAFDPTDQLMFLFGGYNGAARQDTWKWDGTTWTQIFPTTVPAARWIHRMAYDAARDEIVLFGGGGSTTVLRDTWIWNGSNWVQRTPATLPSARYADAIAYDSDRQVVVMFGGQTGFNFGVGPLADTWEWNGTNWSPVAVSGPTARSFVKMVYDQRRRKIVLFGGYNAGFLGDTWELGSDLDIATEPASVAVEIGAIAQLHVVASGTGPFTYQWRKNGAPLTDGGHVSGATTDTLVLDPAEAGDTGLYSVVVSNACGPVVSRDAKLVVPPAPGKTSQMKASYVKATSAVDITYTPACDAQDHTIHYGLLADLPVYGYSGSVCPIGVSGSASFDPGGGDSFFLITGVHGDLEGSYGLDGAGAERPADTASTCALSQSLNPACD